MNALRIVTLLAFASTIAGCQGGATIGSGGGPAISNVPVPVSSGKATSSPTPSATPSPAPTSTSVTVTSSSMVTVGTTGNEPGLVEAPDGTLYINALATIYRSIDNGATWTLQPEPTIAETVLASDSSTSVSPNGTLYYTFDYPYAGNTAVCTSADKAETWTCDPAVAPGGTDRMWVTSPGNDEAYETTNEGLYQTAFLDSNNGGTTWAISQLADEELEPSDGPLLKVIGSNVILQVVDNSGMAVYRYAAGTGLSVPSLVSAVPTSIGATEALPSSTQDTAGNFYLVGNIASAGGGLGVQIGRSTDQGQTYSVLPTIPQTSTGTATFMSIAAGKPGHIAVVYYYTSAANVTDPTSVTVPWSAQVAETYDAFDAIPVWTVATLEPVVHTGGMCANAGCSGDTRYSGDFITAIIDKNEHLNVTWMDEPNAALTPTIRFQRLH
jgi:hypothetical protein